MKKFYVFIGLALSMLAVSCSSDSTTSSDTPVAPEASVTVTVNATLAHEGLVWAEGDVVSVNGVESAALSADAAGLATAQFVVADVEAPLVVVAPASVVSGLNELTLPAVQNYVAEGYDAASYALYGATATATPVEGVEDAFTADVTLSTVCGVISLPLTLNSETAEEEVAIKSISLVANGNAPLCGTWTAKGNVGSEGEIAIELTADETSNVLDLVCEEGAVLSTEEPVYFNFVVPAGAYNGGFEMEVVDTNNHHFILSAAADVVVEPATVVALDPQVFTVVEKGPATLTVTIAEPNITWTEGDAIVVNEELSSEVVAEAVGTSTASFELTDVVYPYSVFYPADLYTTSGSVRFQDAQPLIADGYDRSLLAMVGYSTSNEVTLNNLCGIVSIPFTNLYEGENILIEKVTVTSASGDPIAGKYHINYRTGKASVKAGKTSITLYNGSNDEDCITIEPGKTVKVQFVVPVGSVRNGLKLDVLSSVGLLENHTLFPTGLTVRAGEETAANVYEYKEIKIDAIRTAEELLDFAKCVNMGRYKKYINEEGKVVLGGDIDMSTLAEPWVPIIGSTAVTETNPNGYPLGFDGIFDGCGFSIKNWHTTAPLFGYVAAGATVKNFTIDASCNLTIPELSTFSLDGNPASNLCFGFAVASNMAGTVEGITNNAEVLCNCPDDSYAQSRAAIVGWNAIGGNVRDCVNNAPITLNLGKHTAQTAYIGTVVGRAQSSADTVPAGLYNLENHGKLTINIIDGVTDKNFYIGGISGSANSYTVVDNCKNTADVTFNINNDSGKAALVCMGGIIGYSAGEISNCVNEGNIKHDGLCTSVYSGGVGDIKGSIVAGIVGYQNAAISNCINKGNIYLSGNKFGGRNSVGSITTDKAKSSAAPAAAGIVGYCYIATVDACENYGKITFYQPKGDGSGTSGITVVAGIVAAPWGLVSNCKNAGEIEVTRKYETANVNAYLYVGGIAACDYYAKSQTESSIVDCVNEGNITVDNDLGTSNSAYAGIVGWPGVEGTGQTNVTERCINKGNLVINGTAKVRCGCIQGGSGHIKDCQNFGSLTVNASEPNSVYGGLAGFHTQGHMIQGSSSTGNIVANCSIPKGGVGGLVGAFGNVASPAGTVANLSVKATVKAIDDCCGVGMVVGHFNGNSKTILVGSEDEPVSVAGTLQIGDEVITITADNMETYAHGDTCANFKESAHIFSLVLGQ